MKNIDYLNLKDINAPYEEEIKTALANVVDKGWYLFGENVSLFEKEWAEYCGARFCISCGNGLDALRLVLKAWMEMGYLKKGDEIIVPANTFIATILAVSDCGLTPVLADPDPDTFLLTDSGIESVLTEKTRAILPVHLYGQHCAISNPHGLLVLEDSAQRHCRRSSNSFPAAYSFYPGKNLGALGDAGAVVTDDEALAEIVRKLANYGSKKKYLHEHKGVNTRMDEVQAAVLRIKLKDLDRCNHRRKEIAERYLCEIKNPHVVLPKILSDSVFHIFPIRCERRDDLQAFLAEQGIATQIHYPIPPHRQLAYKECNNLVFPVAEQLSRTELSLPCNQAMSDDDVSRVIDAVNRFLPSPSTLTPTLSETNIAKNIGIFGGAQAFSVLAALVRTKVAAVFIGSAGVGFSALYCSTVSFFGNLSGLGLSFSGVKYLSEVFEKDEKEELRKEVGNLRRLGVICALVGFFLTLLSAPLISRIYFSDFSHILPFAALAFFTATTILGGIELAILKACRRIRQMAISLIWAAVVSVGISVPLYILKGIDGVIWAVVVSGIAETSLTFFFGNKVVGWKECFGSSRTGNSRGLISLGLAFLAGSVIASGADLAIQGFFSTIASFSVLGLYKAGYQVSITYTGMIFTAVSNDFYPRLSAISNSLAERNLLISRQIRVLLIITIPLVLIFILLVPYLLPLLFDHTFTPICRMVQFAALSVIVKSVTMPLNFLPLSLGKARDYLLLEGVFWLLLIPFVIVGYRLGGLTGTGIAIFLCHLTELAYLLLFCRKSYHFRFNKII